MSSKFPGLLGFFFYQESCEVLTKLHIKPGCSALIEKLFWSSRRKSNSAPQSNIASQNYANDDEFLPWN